MHRLAPVALATLLAASAPTYLHAQNAATPFTDPANLRGERVSPRTGRELPIDGGLRANNQPDNALGLQQLLRKLSTRASILNLVAHPDDEDGGMLTLYARGYGARVADLSLTRGEGGQNAMTGDFEDALGLLRTQELLANDRYTGVTQMFGTEVDFGFSKTKAESFAKWNHQRVLYDAVRAIRLFRPLVITATFIGNPTDGHGQHQVSGEIAQEAFVAAGDPNVFPELTKEGILPWQPLKMYARVPTYAISDKGLFDYATGQYVPARFTNYVTGVTSTTPPTPDIVIHEGATDPLLTTCAANAADLPPQLKSVSNTPDCRPLSYVQFARIGLGLQRTQIGPGVRNAPSGRFDVPYHLYGSRLAHQPAQESSFFDGIDTSIEGIASLAPHASPALVARLHRISQDIVEAQRLYDPRDLIATAPPLVHAKQELFELQNEILLGPPLKSKRHADDELNLRAWSKDDCANVWRELRVKDVQVNDALALALGVHLDATTPTDNGDVTSGSAVPVHVTLSVDSKVSLRLFPILVRNDRRKIINAEIPLEQPGHHLIVENFASPFPASGNKERTITTHPEGTEDITRPYFTRPNIEQPFYDLLQPELRNAPASPPALVVSTGIEYMDQEISIARIVHSGPQLIEITPPVSLSFERSAQALPRGTNSLSLDVHVATDDHPQGELRLNAPSEWTVRPPEQPFVKGTRSFVASLPARLPTEPALLTVEATVSGTAFTEGFRPIGYGSLPRTNFYTPATDRIVPVDLKLPPANKRRIAYLEGTGDDVPSALASIGLAPTLFKVSDLTPEKLSHFDTVILGVRTYNAHPDLHGAPTQALLDFARNGGNVVVQYQTREFTAADAPFPLSLGSDEKVVDETDPVEILHPQSTLFTTPNHIVASDFDHFIEERGHGFLGSWDPRYTALTETHDPGQAPQKGGLITVQLGRGRWTYCAFALYRQLPEAVPGAFRLFTNLLTP